MELLEIVIGLIGLFVTIAFISAVIRMDVTTRAMLYELQKVSAALLLVNDLVEGPKAKGRPRIVRAGEHHHATHTLPPAL